MKTFICSFILLILGTVVYAQQSVQYITFFPSAHVAHSTISLTQNSSSFDPDDTTTGYSTQSTVDPNIYLAQHGGLILGAARDAVVNINTITLPENSNDLVDFINNITAENLLELKGNVAGSGSVDHIAIGATCGEDDSSNCERIFISSGKVILTPQNKQGHNGFIGNVYSSGVAKVAKHILPSGDGTPYKVKWVKLRLDGEEACRLYLVRYAINGTAPEDNCNEPS
ncbi:MAG: hypothetical protein J5594_02140 [Elusimicrobiaceae bacterium]|nr:hypothetical protein [Elusimicrobiaceae bacterium]